MPNPILQAMQGTTQIPTTNNLDPTTQLINEFKNSANPQQFVMNMLQANPKVASMVNQATNAGHTYKDLFYAVAQARGVDPNQILNLLR